MNTIEKKALHALLNVACDAWIDLTKPLVKDTVKAMQAEGAKLLECINILVS